MNFGEHLYRDIEKNAYLINLYTKLLKLYTKRIFHIDTIENDDLNCKDIADLLKFADILSKSNNSLKKQIHNNISQNIVVLLDKILQNNAGIKFVMGSVLSNINNYRGLSSKCSGYYNPSIVEFISEDIEKEKYKIDNTNNYFVNSQKDIFNSLNSEKIYSYSGPTSMGKTFVIKTFIMKRILEDIKENFVIIVPTKALISEITSDFIKDLNDNLKLKNYKVINTPNSIIDEDNCQYIMIYTQERFLYHLINIKNINIDYVFIDEAHKFFCKDFRSVFFYKIIDILNNLNTPPNIFFSAPLIENPQEFLKLLPIEYNKNYSVFKFSPVIQQKFILDYTTNNIRVFNDLRNCFIELEDSKINNCDTCYILDILGESKKNLVYCESTNDAVNLAMEYSKKTNTICQSDKLESIKKHIAEEVHPDYFLINLLSKGIAYHIGYIPSSIRKDIEELYKDKIINTIFCTSTLLEGVNLPADNLFINIKSNSKLLKSELDFKNLMGRVGRIKYDLVGNVFILPEHSQKTIKKCTDIIESAVPNQKLSIEEILTDNLKLNIIQNLKSGNTFIDKNKYTFSEYNFIRFIMNSLICDIINDNSSNILNSFNNFITINDKEQIKNNFKIYEKSIPIDASITLDQVKDIDFMIREENLEYPENIKYKNILDFLIKLHKAFNWGIYEPKDGLGNINRLKYYSVILQQWMKSMGLNQIVNYAIKYHLETREIFINKKEEYINSLEQKNHIINNTLTTLDNIILFKLSNYLLKFSKRYMEINNIDSIKNDWHEFVEYGTDNKVVILLQKIGFSREIALKIFEYKYYEYNETEDKIKIDNNIFNDKNSRILDEAKEVLYNNSNYFFTS